MQIDLILESIKFILPVWIANMSCVFCWFFRKKGLLRDKPVDFGKNFFDRKRFFGDGVSICGVLISAIMGTTVGLLQGRVLDGFVLAVGGWFGNCIASFFKRRLSLKRGDFFPVIDHIDYILGALILYSLFNPIETYIIFYSVILTLVFHPLICYIGYKLNIKEKPW